MNLLIRQVSVIDPGGSHHGQQVDIWIKGGMIRRIGRDIHPETGAQLLDGEGAYVSAGWLDIGVQTGDPGYEHREDLRTAAAAAAAGGFTGIGCLPNTQPVIDGKSEVLYVRNSTSGGLMDCYPVGAVSKDCAGKDITEMIDMQAAGAVAFSDGKNPVQDSGLMLRALQYVTAFDGVVMNQPLDTAIAGDGQMHEGLTSTSLGLKGIANLAEELMVQRDLELLAYSGSRLHLSNLSTAGAVERVRQAKARGLALTCSVAALNLLLTDEALQDFDSNLKVLPPLRSMEDRQALIEGLRDGTIDIISANHVPLEEEVKKLEFPFAKFGATGLETAFATANTALSDALPLEALIDCLCLKPRKLFGLPQPRIAEGESANLTVFDPARRRTVTGQQLRSKSRNMPLSGYELSGVILAVVNNNQSVLFANP